MKPTKRINLINKRRVFKLPIKVVFNVSAATLFLIAANLGVKFGKQSATALCVVERPTPAAAKISSSPVVEKKTVETVNVLENDLALKVKSIPGVEALEQQQDGKEVKVTLNSDAFFQTGTANLDQSSEDSIKEIAKVFKGVLAKTQLEIEGHTDDSPVVKQKKLYRSNWELSLARAASMVHVFEEAGYIKEKLKVTGYGDSRPLVPNRTIAGEVISTNLAKNRRIVLRLFANGQEGGVVKPL